jgi:hypothetical protein
VNKNSSPLLSQANLGELFFTHLTFFPSSTDQIKFSPNLKYHYFCTEQEIHNCQTLLLIPPLQKSIMLLWLNGHDNGGKAANTTSGNKILLFPIQPRLVQKHVF